jgi:hypothetical protein
MSTANYSAQPNINPLAAEVGALALRWAEANRVLHDHHMPAAAHAELCIIEAIKQAEYAGLTLLQDDLSAALKHVDGCWQAHNAKVDALAAAEEQARSALIIAGGINPRSPGDVARLYLLLDRSGLTLEQRTLIEMEIERELGADYT